MLPKEWKSIPLHQIQHREEAPLLLGCPSCKHFSQCTGLHLEFGLTDCQEFCNCPDPEQCDVVCASAPNRFVQRIREVGGFESQGLAKGGTAAWPISHSYIPIIDKPLPGLDASRLLIAALSFGTATKRTSTGLIALSANELADKFGGTPIGGWVLTGVDHDYRIEHIWGLGKAERMKLFLNLAASGIKAATSPNFSLIADVPRTDNLYSRKRVAIVWSELNSAGVNSALHLNARTAGDFKFFADVIKNSDCDAVSFEFGTGAAASEAGSRYVERLVRFRSYVDRPLNLIIRGGSSHYAKLLPAFKTVTQLDTAAHMKTKYRQVLRRGVGHRGYRWATENTDLALGELFINATEQCHWVDMLARQRPAPKQIKTRVLSRNTTQPSANDETHQLRLLP